VVDDLADLSEVERRLFPKPADTWTPNDWFTFFATAQRLADQYGKERIVALVDELVLVGAGPTRDGRRHQALNTAITTNRRRLGADPVHGGDARVGGREGSRGQVIGLGDGLFAARKLQFRVLADSSMATRSPSDEFAQLRLRRRARVGRIQN
jgi:hypothetical protein